MSYINCTEELPHEFEVGDTVTFDAYMKPINCTVLEVKTVKRLISNEIEVAYKLEGKPNNKISHGYKGWTNGKCIVQSKYFIKPTYR